MKALAAICAVTLSFLSATAIARQHFQTGTLSGVSGVPVEGHEIIVTVQFAGHGELDFRRLDARLQENGIRVRLGRPLESVTLCQLKEVVRDMLAEKGFPDAVITHDLTRALGDPEAHMKLTITISQGERSKRASKGGSPPLSSAERCAR